MKILMLQDDFPPQSFGGAGFSVFHLACALQKAGHRVFIITTCQKKSDETDFEYEGLKIFRIFSNFHERRRAYLALYNPQTVGRVKKIIHEINPDIVHAHNIHGRLSYHCLKIAKNFKKPVFLYERDAMAFCYGKLATKKYLENFDARVSWFDNLKFAQKRYNPFRNFFIKRYLRYVDKIFVLSSAHKKALEQNGINNAEVHYTGINIADWQTSSESIEEFKRKYGIFGKKVVFFGGRISTLKGSEQTKEAMEKIKKEVPEAFLLTVGNQGIGWLRQDELKVAYHCADIVIVPSVYLDAFPRSVLEGMACSKPIVASCYGGASEAVQDGVTGYVVNPFNTELMAEKIIDLLKNPEKAERFGRSGYERIKKHFSLDSHVARTLSWYQKFMSNDF